MKLLFPEKLFLILVFFICFVLAPFLVDAKVFYAERPAEDNIVEAIIRVSEKTGIRPVLLWGLFGQETGHGGNLGKTESGWASFCSYRYGPDCRNWTQYDCKGDYINSRHYDEILTALGFIDNSGRADRSQIPTSSTCALGFTQFEPNTWWLVLRGRGEPISKYSPWVLQDALVMAAFYLEDLGADGGEVADRHEAIGKSDKTALQKYYCGGLYYMRSDCVSYANSITRIAQAAPEVLFVKGFQNQLEVLSRQREIRRRRAIQEEIDRIERERRRQEWQLIQESEDGEGAGLKEKQEQEYTLPPGEQPKENPYIVTDKLPVGGIGDNYNVKLVARGGRPPYTWRSYTSLPNGLRLDSRAGVIAGTPNVTTPGLSLQLEVMDSDGVSAIKQMLLVIEKLPLSISTDKLPKGLVGTSYSVNIYGSGGEPPLRWESESVLPEGLRLDSSTGVLSGIPVTKAEAHNLNIKVTDSVGAVAKKTLVLTVKISPLSILTAKLPNAAGETFYSFTLSADGGTPPYIWSIASGDLPAGLSLDPNAGTIFGIPSVNGFWNINFAVNDSAGQIITKELPLEIKSPVIINAPEPQKGVVKTFYRYFVSATGGTEPYVWDIVSGELPKGFNINDSGEISGTPEEAKSSSFTVRVIDKVGAKKTKSLTIEVKDQLSINTETILPAGTVRATYGVTFSVSGGIAPYNWSVAPPDVLPANGLHFDSFKGVISGVPKEAKPSNFIVTVTDAAGSIITKVFSLEIQEVLPVPTPEPPMSSTSTVFEVSPSGFMAGIFEFLATSFENISINLFLAR